LDPGEEKRLSVIPISYYLVLSAILFGLGAVGVVFKRNIITILMSIELMLNAVNLAFVAFARAHGQIDGLVFVFFVIVVAAAEAAVGLAIVIMITQNRQSLNVERINLLKF
jgi:NADH-quinone oxidoreductase subunit K